jgi:hypothetical protein
MLSATPNPHSAFRNLQSKGLALNKLAANMPHTKEAFL